MAKCWCIALLVTALAVPCLYAQMRGSGRSSVPAYGLRSEATPLIRPALHRNRELYLGAPFFYSGYYGDDANAGSPGPQIVVVSPPPPANPPSPPAEPLTIELQGNKYARFSEQAASATPFETRAASPSTTADLPPAILIFRDASRTEVNRYAIIDGVLYADTDYLTTGSWTRRIRLSDLNLPATVATNQDRGVKFLLPTGPNQVVTRP